MLLSSALGIEFDSKSLRLAHIVKDKNIKVNKALVIPLNRESMLKGRKIDEEFLSSALKHTLSKENIKERRAIVTLSGQDVVIRKVSLPCMPDRELKEAVKWEAAQYIPGNDRFIIDYKVVEQKAENGIALYKVVIAGVLEHIALAYYQVIKKSGLKLAAIDVKGFSLLRGFKSDLLKDKHTVLIDLGNDEVYIVIARDGVFQASRAIPYSQKLNPSSDRYLYDHLKNEILRFFSFYSTQNRGASVEKVFISGDVEFATARLAEKVQNELNMDVKLVNWESCIFERPEEHIPDLSSCIMPIGAALWGMNL